MMNNDKLKKIIESEGNFYEWTNTLKCFIQRNQMDVWCGYVTIPKSFPLDFKKEINLDCHGGVTYQDINTDGDLVVGFDCGHHGDLIPSLKLNDLKLLIIDDFSTYRDKQYVISEVNSMVDQVIHIVEVNRHLRIDEILNN